MFRYSPTDRTISVKKNQHAKKWGLYYEKYLGPMVLPNNFGVLKIPAYDWGLWYKFCKGEIDYQGQKIDE